jgi:dTDP-4-dehydrorhamnose reductase
VGRTLLVTGGTGLLGRRLVRQAAERGWAVLAPTRHQLDLLRPGTVVDLVAAARPAAVIHTAYAKASQDDLDRVVVAGTEAVARAAAAAGARLVHLSSDTVFSGALPDDGDGPRPWREDDPTDAISAYGRAKDQAERRVLAAVPGATVVRTSLLLGDPDDPGPQELLARDPAATHWADCHRQPCSAADLATALLDLLDLLDLADQDGDRDGGRVAGPLHLAGADVVDRATLAELIAGGPVRRTSSPPGIPLDTRLDLTRARDLLPRMPRGIRSLLPG